VRCSFNYSQKSFAAPVPTLFDQLFMDFIF
jgi:hypothetical protein